MAVNRFTRVAGQWLPVGVITNLPPQTPTSPGGTITHGEHIPAMSSEALAVLGPRGTLAEWTGPTTLTGTQVITGRVFNNVTLTIASGADITFRNCRIIGPPAQTTYTVRATAGGGLRVQFEQCEIIARAGSNSVRCVTMWGDGNLRMVGSVCRGGIDNLYLNPDNTPGLFPTEDELVPAARVLLDESWFGDVERRPSTHTDCIQIDGGGYTLIRRSRIMCYNIPSGSDTLLTHADGTSFGSGGLIATQNSSNPAQISHVALRDSWVEGGNYTVDLNPSDGLPVGAAAATGNKFGLAHQFGPLRMPPGSPNVDNRWGQSGVTVCCGVVSAGALIAGST